MQNLVRCLSVMNITKIRGELGCMQGHCAHLLKYVENPVLCVNAQYHPFVIFKKADIANIIVDINIFWKCKT